MEQEKKRSTKKKQKITDWGNFLYKKIFEQSFQQKQLDSIKHDNFVADP